MASIVQICNMALSHIGSDARVSSISPPDGSVEAGHCATFYDQARTEMLEPGNWGFALKRTLLAQSTNASDTWLYAYSIPSDCLRPLRILTPVSGVTVFTQDTASYQAGDSDSATFEREGQVLYSNEPDAVLLYTCDVDDVTRYSPSFTTALSYLLAGYIAGPILKGSDGLRTGDAMRERAMRFADMSATAAANGSVSTSEFTPAQLRFRQ
jgi:hypothetical protein